MAHYLAEAICELAAPPLQPSFIRLVARQGDDPNLAILLHVRPHQLSAGLEVAAYSGIAQGEEATEVHIRRQGTVFAVRQSQAGLEQFVADLITTSPEEYDDRACKLLLPFEYSKYGAAWDSMQLDLLAPSEVQLGAPVGPGMLRVSLPSVFQTEGRAAAVEVENRAAIYGWRQRHLKEQQQQAAAAAGVGSSPGASGGASSGAASAAALERPDNPAEFEHKYLALRGEAMAQLQATLLAMLRQALRYRGRIEFPGAPPLPPAAPAAPAGDGADP